MILVVGGTGFVGSAIVRELIARGQNVSVLSRDSAKAAGRFPGADVQFRRGDHLTLVFDEPPPGTVAHAVAITSNGRP